jgi:CRISPR-associated protein Cmr1
MMGGVVGGDIGKVRQLEAEIFGSTERASVLRIRVNAPAPQGKPWDFQLRSDRGIVYLGYGLSGSRTTPRRVYVMPDPPGYEFELTLFCQRERAQSVAIGTLWLLTQFGGLGARMRRGFGSLEISQVTGDLPLNVQGLFASPREPLAKRLQRNLMQVRKLFADFASAKIQEPTDPIFPVISKDHWVCRVLDQTFASWRDAMNWIGEGFRKYREDRTRGLHTRTAPSGSFSYYISKDYDEAKKLFIPGQRPGRLDLPIFGLPLQFQFQSIRNTARVVGEEHERRSSPLHIRVRRDAEGYRVCLICFKSRFLSDQERLRIEDINNPRNFTLVPVPGWQDLDGFISQFAGQEVKV